MALSYTSARNWIRYCRRRLKWYGKYFRAPKHGFDHFRCNVCGRQASFPHNQMTRELESCSYCGSNVRWRSLIHALSTELFGVSLPIPDFPSRPDLVGIGLSDWEGYATRLTEKLSYTNTYYHQPPFLDIASVDPSQYGQYDFIIASEVFEHIAPPVSRAFENVRRLLKPNGVLIFTVPCVAGKTKEHFPELHQYSLHKRAGNWVLLNQTSDGRLQEFTEVIFHGGPGTVVEMRLFGKESLLQNFEDAGFASVHPYDDEVPQYGIHWLPYDPENAPYRPLLYGLDAPPWAARIAVPGRL